jgi:hypothetical protein
VAASSSHLSFESRWSLTYRIARRKRSQGNAAPRPDPRLAILVREAAEASTRYLRDLLRPLFAPVLTDDTLHEMLTQHADRMLYVNQLHDTSSSTAPGTTRIGSEVARPPRAKVNAGGAGSRSIQKTCSIFSIELTRSVTLVIDCFTRCLYRRIAFPRAGAVSMA